MRIPVYEKQTVLRVNSASAGEVARPVEQAFSRNHYTQLAQGLASASAAGVLLEGLRTKPKQKAEKSSAVSAPLPASAGERSSVTGQAEWVAGAQQLLASAVVQAQEQASVVQKQEEESRRQALAQAVAPLAASSGELERFIKKNFDSSPNKPALCARAVGNYISASLAQGLTPQAADVLARLGNYLPPQARQGATRRLEVSAGERAAQTVIQKTFQGGKSPADWNDTDLETLTQEAASHLPPGVMEETRLALQAAAGEARTNRQKEKASLLGQVLQPHTQDNPKALCQTLYTLAQVFPQEEKTLNAAVRQWKSNPAKTSNAGVFNRLYKQLGESDFKENKLEEEFSSGRLNGRDYVLLKRERASIQGGEDARARRLLWAAAERLCRKENLTLAEADDFKYAVFSQDGDSTAKLSALKKLRDVYFL